LLFLVGEISVDIIPNTFQTNNNYFYMKKLFLILAFMLSAIATDAQQRIIPMMDITNDTYDEAIELLQLMDRTAYIEKLEGIDLDNEYLTTSYGEISLRQDGKKSIRITIVEFTKMLSEHSHTNKRFYGIDKIKTELILQTSDMYEYMSRQLVRNPRVKNMYIKIDQKTGGAYIQVDFYKM
jgi:hypothetical protein